MCIGFVPIDVIKNSREAEALTLKLGFVLRATRGVQAQRAELLRALVRGGTLEYRREVVGDGDQHSFENP